MFLYMQVRLKCSGTSTTHVTTQLQHNCVNIAHWLQTKRKVSKMCGYNLSCKVSKQRPHKGTESSFRHIFTEPLQHIKANPYTVTLCRISYETVATCYIFIISATKNGCMGISTGNGWNRGNVHQNPNRQIVT